MSRESATSPIGFPAAAPAGPGVQERTFHGPAVRSWPFPGWKPGGASCAALLSFLGIAAGVLAHNRSLFTTRIWEVGDAAANSLLVNDAKHLRLLVGHYSRVGFNHPGPAVMYVQAAGETLFYNLLNLTPGPYNAQVVAIVLLEAAVMAAITAVLWSWSRQAAVVAPTLAVALAWYAFQPYALSSTWMPFVVVPPFLLLMVAAASVAAGHVEHLWLLAAAAGLLVHAHVEFVLFAPALVLASLATWALSERRGLPSLWRAGRRHWAKALAVAALFVLPIFLNTALNWPGEVPKYLQYSGTQAGVRPTTAQALLYARQFWGGASWMATIAPALLITVALAVARLAPPTLRRPLTCLVGAAVLAELLFVVYAKVGIDDLSQTYVGYFSRSVPLALVLVAVAGTAARASGRLLGSRAVIAVGVAASAVVLVTPGFGLRSEGLAALPGVIDQVQQAAGNRTAVLDIGSGTAAFLDGSGVLLALERAGRPACFRNPDLRVQLTPRRECTAEQTASGVQFLIHERGTGPVTFPGALADFAVVRP